MSKVLITGAGGFIGSHLTELLLAEGFNVKAFCQYNSKGSFGWLDTIPNSKKKEIEIVLGDIRDPFLVKNVMTDCDSVFHLAALIAIPYSYVAPKDYIDTNIHGTLNVLNAAKDLNIDRVIHTSTSETYGTAQFVPINESHPLVGQSPYAASKIGADQLALSYWRSFDTPVSVLRPFNTYGPRQSMRAVIPTIIAQIISGSRNIKLGSLTPTRDFNFVKDTCKAFLALAKSDLCIGKVINSSSNFEISIKDTALIISELMEIPIEIATEDQRLRPEKSEVNRLYGDNTLIKSLTDWTPNHEGIKGLRSGLKETIEWFSKKENLYKYNSYNYSL